jgi:4'-phosphopantetheinyl transferase EntD
MAPHLKPKFNPASSSGCFVGLLDACELQDKEYPRLLSVDERTKYMSLSSQTRKSEWLAGRLAAKYIFLSRLETSQEIQKPWNPTLSKLSSEALGVYSPWMYQKVEVVTRGGKPGLVWCGQARPESISLSHSGGVSCASMAFGATAIDIETAAPRLDAFYRINFTEAERCWATRAAAGESIRSNWYFTLLWTLKESALKLEWLDQASVWNLPRIEIDGLPGVNDIGPFWFSNTMNNDFAVFTVSLKEHCRVMSVQVAVTATRNLILTVMNPLGGVIK